MPTVVDAVERSTRIRAGRATGWPVVVVALAARPDPLKRLHLDLGAAGKQLTGTVAHVARRPPTPVQRARVDTEVRALADDGLDRISAGPGSTPYAAPRRPRLDDLGDRLDAAMAGTDLGVAKIPCVGRRWYGCCSGC